MEYYIVTIETTIGVVYEAIVSKDNLDAMMDIWENDRNIDRYTVNSEHQVGWIIISHD